MQASGKLITVVTETNEVDEEHEGIKAHQVLSYWKLDILIDLTRFMCMWLATIC
jgi:hypothetical protein